MIRSLTHRLPAMAEMASDLFLRRYPSFVYGSKPQKNELPPIFCFHDACQSTLEPLLVALKAGGYRTLVCDEYLALVRGEIEVDASRSLMLTFDDGVASVWTTAYPLFKRYGLQAVVFLIPGRIQEACIGGPRPTLAEVWAGETDQASVLSTSEDEPLCTWDEIRQMHHSGIFDFQAHTLTHNRVFINSRIVEFVTPVIRNRLQPHDLLLWDEPFPKNQSYISPPLGAPIYESRPRMLADRAYREDQALRDECMALVDEMGGARFFDLPNWQKLLSQTARRYRLNGFQNHQWETAECRDAAIRSELLGAKTTIEQRLPNKRVRHLAWPWGVAGEHAVQIAQSVGYESCYWGKASGRLKNLAGHDPLRLTRIGEDFLPLLPGIGKTSLAGVLKNKVLRRGGSTAA